MNVCAKPQTEKRWTKNKLVFTIYFISKMVKGEDLWIQSTVVRTTGSYFIREIIFAKDMSNIVVEQLQINLRTHWKHEWS